MYTIANCPAVQRDLYLARCLRQEEDPPRVSTLSVAWNDMVVSFATDAAISEASVQVSEEISIARFTARMESLLDCGARSEGAAEWVLKYSTRISDYGSAKQVRRLLCDKIAALDPDGETIGVLKIKRRSVDAGHAKVRLVPTDDSLQLVVRHQTAQGLKAVWKSVLWRLRPQHGDRKTPPSETTAGVNPAVRRVWPPCVLVRENRASSNFSRAAGWLSEQGVEVDLSKPINTILPLGGFAGRNLNWGSFYCRVEFGGRLPPGKPESISMDGNAVEVQNCYWRNFAEEAKFLSDWLGLGWTLPAEG